ncbi:hypothetical protein GGI43DRAFT_101092 [Trichoderma evansii]
MSWTFLMLMPAAIPLRRVPSRLLTFLFTFSLAAVPWVERPRRNGAAKMPHGGKTLRRLERPIGKLIEMAAPQFTTDSKACAILVQQITMNQLICNLPPGLGGGLILANTLAPASHHLLLRTTNDLDFALGMTAKVEILH